MMISCQQKRECDRGTDQLYTAFGRDSWSVPAVTFPQGVREHWLFASSGRSKGFLDYARNDTISYRLWFSGYYHYALCIMHC